MDSSAANSEFDHPEPVRPARLGRWFGLVLALVAYLAFELTLEPALAAIIMCCQFGMQDLLTALWLRRTDPQRERGQACGWFLVNLASTKVVLTAFVFAMVATGVMEELAKRQPQNAIPRDLPPGFIGTVIIMMVGLPLGTLACFIGCLQASRYGIRVWLDPALGRARRNQSWPPTGFGVQNLANLPVLVMKTVFVGLIVCGVPVVGLLTGHLLHWLVPAIGLEVPTIGGLMVGLVAAAWAIGGLMRVTTGVCAAFPGECWPVE